MIVFNFVTPDNNRTFILSRNLTRDIGLNIASGSIQLEGVPEEASVEAFVSDVRSNGVVGVITQSAMIIGPGAITTTPEPGTAVCTVQGFD